jgi:hypothetical protein
MHDVSAEYLTRAEFWLLFTTLVYFLMNGAQIFETAVITPKWTSAPPDSFGMFKGKHGLDFKAFWIALHSVHEVTFILAIILCWQLDFIRNVLLILFAVHFLVRAWTLAYFAPNIIRFQKIASDSSGAEDLEGPVDRWRNLNYLRVLLFILISIAQAWLYVKCF